MGEVEKSSFYCFARQREPQWANALKAVWPTLEGVVRSLTVFKEQSVISLWTILELACIKVKFQESSINLLVSTSQGSVFWWSAVFIWRGSASSKNSLRMYVRPLSIYFRELGVG